ncbi:MAG: hypothetical protein KBS86_02345 [Proteobacteria bacterium]|nr:hypothetical protein [Candidatus Enterousia scatequi]
MFNNANIVQSAVSAFNNAALSAPAFFWAALLASPIFVLVYKHSQKLISIFNWNTKQIPQKICLWTVALTLVWVVLFGGNYGVLRDSQTLLPWVIAFILFMSCLFLGYQTQTTSLPAWKKQDPKHKTTIICGILLGLFILAMSDTHTWWGPILQISSCMLGLFIGRKIRKNIPNISICNIIMLTTIIAILMQPEFFRFGQLGNLSPIHLIMVTIFGLCIAAEAATHIIKPGNKIRQSAYIKLKWMTRVLTILGFAMFLITESVPTFIITSLIGYIMFGMSIKHATRIPANMEMLFFGFTVCAFGVLTTMPVITCLGILQIATISDIQDTVRQSNILL